MGKYFDILLNSYSGYIIYLKNEVLYWNWHNYFYGLLSILLLVWLLEITFPWRKNQSFFRKDFWLDLFYLFFNFFLLNLILLIALSNITEQFINDVLHLFGLELISIQLFSISKLLQAVALFMFFITSDFIQWNVHRLLNTFPFLRNIHKTHHSIKEMVFAGHFRYSWMEPIVYKSIWFVPTILIKSVNLKEVFILHLITIAISHLNHANLGWDYGKKMPNEYGVNFGISLSI